MGEGVQSSEVTHTGREILGVLRRGGGGEFSFLTRIPGPEVPGD